MKIYSVYDPEFKAYGQVITGLSKAVEELLPVLAASPQEQGVDYVPKYAPFHDLDAAQQISDHLYGGMPVQLGWCNGHNTKLNCLEYHRDSEYNLGTEDFILLLAKQDEVVDGVLDTAKVKAFKVPADTLVEVFATTLHYAPCHCDPAKGFRVLVALPLGTNTDKPQMDSCIPEDHLLWARNKWLLAHKDSTEAAAGAHIGLSGENIDIANLI